MDSLVKAFLDTLLWSSTDDKGKPLDRDYDITDIQDITKVSELIEEFKTAVENDSVLQSFETITEHTGNAVSNIMHDLCLTINGHGSGFWDGNYSDDGIGSGIFGDKLTAICHTLPTIDLYVGDDGNLYIY